ncbi:hypothetical protein D3C75_1178490 [compost metagenome]
MVQVVFRGYAHQHIDVGHTDIGIEQEDFAPHRLQRKRKVQGEIRFADSPFAAADGNDTGRDSVTGGRLRILARNQTS